LNFLTKQLSNFTRQQTTRGNKKMVIQGRANWACVQAPNDKFPPPVYCVDLVIDDANAATLRTAGINVKEKDGELFIKAKR